MKRPKILITSALPYANGSIHLGHLVEYIQTDIFVRFLKLMGENAIYCCADDTHGAPIEINAKKQGISPEELIAKYHKEHQEDFSAFHILFDSYYTTNSSENKKHSEFVFNQAKKKGFIYQKEIQQLYCGHCKRFLPDRYVRGECPKCHANDQYGDVCEKCGSTHKPTELIGAKCAECGNAPSQKSSLHYFFRLSTFSEKLRAFLDNQLEIQPEVQNFIVNWINEGLQDWDITRDGPYFGFLIPGETDKYFYVWLDAPIGYIASTEHYCRRHKQRWEEYWKSEDARIIHFIGKDIIYFHFLFWPAMLMASGLSLPKKIQVHGHLTLNKEKMSKSRGTFITARKYLEHLPPEYLRFYYAANLPSSVADLDLDLADFAERINAELVANIANFIYRVLSFTRKQFDGKLSEMDRHSSIDQIEAKYKTIEAYYQTLEFRQVVKEILAVSDMGNRYFQEMQPWKLVKENREKTQKVLTTSVNMVKNLAILLEPILPRYAAAVREQIAISGLTWQDLGFTLENHTIGEPAILFKPLLKEAEALLPGVDDTRIISYSLENGVQKLGVKVRIAQINNVSIKKKHEGIERLKKELKQQQLADPNILAAYEELDKNTGVDSSTHPNAVSNLLALLQTKGQLPQINTAVDVYNIVSLQTGVAMATHDLARLQGNLTVRLSKNKEPFISLGNVVEGLSAGEVVYADEHSVVGRFSKQCERTQTTTATRNLVLVAFGNCAITEQHMDDCIEKTCALLVKFNGGSYTVLPAAATDLSVFPADLRVGKIIEAKNHPSADKLYVLTVDLCSETRHIVSGLKGRYTAQELQERNIVMICNLKPAVLRGVKSEGMVLTGHESKTSFHLLECPHAKPGTSVGPEGMAVQPAPELTIDQFYALGLSVQGKKAAFGSKVLHAGKHTVSAPVKDGSVVR
ncbi:methionine--tRNA ligase [Candidatus Woesearchaeota archaeon]|nr:methionine--tRNA ligase [Candidatus Woesearchaeota archaeon]